MPIALLHLIIDFGFAVLIWAVQLVIYPSFKFYTPENLVKWHRIYTQKITIIVLPLMFSQLAIAVIHLWNTINLFTVASIVIITALWLLTFLIFVPLHQLIDKALHNDRTVTELVQKNRIRTFLWSLLFVISTVNYLLNY